MRIMPFITMSSALRYQSIRHNATQQNGTRQQDIRLNNTKYDRTQHNTTRYNGTSEQYNNVLMSVTVQPDMLNVIMPDVIRLRVVAADEMPTWGQFEQTGVDVIKLFYFSTDESKLERSFLAIFFRLLCNSVIHSTRVSSGRTLKYQTSLKILTRSNTLAYFSIKLVTETTVLEH